MAKKKSKQPQHASRIKPLIWILGGLALVALAVLAAALIKPRSSYTAEVTGGPSLRVDRQKADLGDVRLGTPVSVDFTLTNVGDRPLKFNEQPWIEVKEGC